MGGFEHWRSGAPACYGRRAGASVAEFGEVLADCRHLLVKVDALGVAEFDKRHEKVKQADIGRALIIDAGGFGVLRDGLPAKFS